MEAYSVHKVGNPSKKFKAKLHDRALAAAAHSKCTVYVDKRHVTSDRNPYKSVFVARFGPATTEQALHSCFSQYGRIRQVSIIRCLVTGVSKRYGFVEFSKERYARRALKSSIKLEGAPLLVDCERSYVQPEWKPRRLGGGLGGKISSGQLRFA